PEPVSAEWVIPASSRRPGRALPAATIAATKATDERKRSIQSSSDRGVYEYTAYGARLTSALRLPELPPRDGETGSSRRWQLEVHDAAPSWLRSPETLGEATYAGGARLVLERDGPDWRLSTSDAGIWSLAPAAGRMHWHRFGAAREAEGADEPGRAGEAREAREAVARYDAIGRVMPLMLHAVGALCLHGSGVATADGGFAILGPKGRGKSTLALACVSAGASLAGDDVAVLRPGSAPMLEPGAPFSRLRMDSA